MPGQIVDRLVAVLGFDVDKSSAQRAQNELGQFNKQTKRFQERVQSIGKSFARVGATMAGAGAAGALVGKKILDATVPFQEAINRIAAASAGLTEQQLNEQREKAKEIGRTTAASAQQAADGFVELAKAGQSHADAMRTIEHVTSLAIAAEMEMGAAAEAVVNGLNIFGLSAEETERYVDALANTARSATTTVPQLALALKEAGPPANALGISVEDTAAAIGAMQSRGLDASKAGTGLRNMLLGILTPSTNAKKAISSLGLDLDDLKKQLQSGEEGALFDVFSKLQAAGLDAETAAVIFGRESQAAAISFASAAEDARSIAETSRQAEGLTKRQAQTMLAGISGALKELDSAVQGLLIQLGDSGFIEWLDGFIRAGTKLINRFTEYLKDAPPIVMDLIKAITIGLPILGALGTAITAIGFAMSVASPQLFLIAAAVTAVIAVVYLLWKNWEKVLEWIRSKFQEFSNWLGTPAGEIVNALFPVLGLIRNIGNAFLESGEKAKRGMDGWTAFVASYKQELAKTEEGQATVRVINKVEDISNAQDEWVQQKLMPALGYTLKGQKPVDLAGEFDTAYGTDEINANIPVAWEVSDKGFFPWLERINKKTDLPILSLFAPRLAEARKAMEGLDSSTEEAEKTTTGLENEMYGLGQRIEGTQGSMYTLRAAMRGGASDLDNTVTPAWGALGGEIEQAGDLMGFFSSAGETIAYAWGRVVAGLKSAWTWVKEGIAAGLSSVGAWFSGLFSDIADAATSATDAGADLGAKLWDAFTGAIGNVWEWLEELFGTADAASGGALSTAAAAGAQLGVGLWNAAKGAVGSVGAWLSGLFSDVTDAVVSTASAGAKLGSNLWSSTKDAVGSVGAWLSGLFSDLSGAIGATAAAGAQLGVNLWNGLVDAVGSVWGWLRGIFDAGAEGSSDALASATEAGVNLGRSLWYAIKGAVGSVGAWLSDLFSDLSGAMGSVTASGAQLGVNLWNAITGAVTGVWGWIEGIFSVGAEGASEALGRAAAAGAGLASALWSSFTGAIGNVVDWIVGLLTEDLPTLAQAGLDAGAALIQGLVDGISNAWETAQDWIDDRPALRAAVDFLGLGRKEETDTPVPVDTDTPVPADKAAAFEAAAAQASAQATTATEAQRAEPTVEETQKDILDLDELFKSIEQNAAEQTNQLRGTDGEAIPYIMAPAPETVPLYAPGTQNNNTLNNTSLDQSRHMGPVTINVTMGAEANPEDVAETISQRIRQENEQLAYSADSPVRY